jgi:hypothetical protein
VTDAVGVPAPELLEVAQTWWDVDHVPMVTWNDDGTAYDLTDPEVPDHRLELLRLAAPPADPPRRIAEVLAEGLASCDFPPTGERASPNRVAATLRAARLAVELRATS